MQHVISQPLCLSEELPPPSLRAAQEWLAAQILSATDTTSPSCEWILARPPAGEIAERLAVHRCGYPARVETALADTYPAIAHLVGEAAFHRLAERHARSLSRHSYNLNDVGADLPSFLRDDPLAEELPFVPDLATLESRIASAFHAFERPPFAPEGVAGWSLEELASACLAFQPSLAIVRSSWPVVVLWEARATPVEEIDIDLRDRPQIALVHRRGFDVACTGIDALEAECLEALAAGESLGAVAAGLAGRADGEAVAAWFARWSSLGLVTDCARVVHPDRPAPPFFAIRGSRALR